MNTILNVIGMALDVALVVVVAVVVVVVVQWAIVNIAQSRKGSDVMKHKLHIEIDVEIDIPEDLEPLAYIGMARDISQDFVTHPHSERAYDWENLEWNAEWSEE